MGYSLYYACRYSHLLYGNAHRVICFAYPRMLPVHFETYRVYKKKVEPFKFKLSIAYCIILTTLIASN